MWHTDIYVSRTHLIEPLLASKTKVWCLHSIIQSYFCSSFCTTQGPGPLLREVVPKSWVVELSIKRMRHANWMTRPLLQKDVSFVLLKEWDMQIEQMRRANWTTRPPLQKEELILESCPKETWVVEFSIKRMRHADLITRPLLHDVRPGQTVGVLPDCYWCHELSPIWQEKKTTETNSMSATCDHRWLHRSAAR